MKTLFYYGVELNIERTKDSDIPYYDAGIFSYTLEDEEDEQKIRNEIKDRCIKNACGEEVLIPEPFQTFPSEMSKKEIEKNTKYYRRKTFYWIN